MYFKYEIEDSHVKINFTYELFISNVELKQFTYAILSSYVKLYVRFMQGLRLCSCRLNG